MIPKLKSIFCSKFRYIVDAIFSEDNFVSMLVSEQKVIIF